MITNSPWDILILVAVGGAAALLVVRHVRHQLSGKGCDCSCCGQSLRSCRSVPAAVKPPIASGE